MPSNDVVVERPNPRDPSAPKKFYVHAKSRGEVTIQEIAAEIAKMSTIAFCGSLDMWLSFTFSSFSK